MGSSLLADHLFLNPLLTSALSFLLAAPASLADGFPVLLADTPFLTKLVSNIWVGVQVALGLGFVIFVHELGHFLAAKTFGVRCDKFYVGFDVPISIGPIKFPRTLGKFQWGETEYGIGIIPLGGYVKMLGQDDDPRKAEIEAEKIRLGESEDAGLDPRSYPAKPVWQRMIIISAGVVMNLIFAVILAGTAYWFGVPYQPTVTGATLAGGPAWEAGIEPGDQILRFGSMTEDDPNLRYEDFATGVAIRGFEKKDEPLKLTLLRGAERIELTANPTAVYSPDRDIYRLGLLSQLTPKVGATPYWKGSFLAESEPDLKTGDVVVAVDGEPLPEDPRFGEVLGSELTARLQAKWREPVALTIARPSSEPGQSPQTLQVELPAVPVKTLGLGFEMGPITAIQAGSIADKAGMQVGDTIEAINGEPVIDALRVPEAIARLAGQEVQLTLRRPLASPASTGGAGASSPAAAESLEITFQNTPAASFDTIASTAGRLSLGGLGVAFDVRPRVTQVADDVAAESGIEIGDELIQYHWIVTSAEQAELSDRFTSLAFDPQVIDESINIASLFDFLQGVPVASKIKLFLRRDGKTRESIVELQYAQDWYWHQRGIGLTPFNQIHKTDSLAAAASLGLWETKRRFNDVLNFLRLLVTGKIGAKGVGGPLAIAEAASAEASNGVSRLMIFLTLLSANLAILNFLPIPALDGGHMVFLTAEAIRGKPVSEALQIRLTMVGVLGLLSLMAFVIVKDIMRYL